MLTVAIIIHVIVSVLLVVTVLLHSGKGASMGSSFGGSTSSQALFGSAGPATLFTKVTAVCAGIFMLTSLYITYASSHRDSASIMHNLPTVVKEPVKVKAEPIKPLKTERIDKKEKAVKKEVKPVTKTPKGAKPKK